MGRPAPETNMRDRLRYLYGEELGDQTHGRLMQLLDRYRPQIKAEPPRDEPFDETDALLITYGDTFHAKGRPPLQALREFAARQLRGRLSGIHVLPFFPYSSDYGF